MKLPWTKILGAALGVAELLRARRRVTVPGAEQAMQRAREEGTSPDGGMAPPDAPSLKDGGRTL